MFESLCKFFKKKKKRSIPYTKYNEVMDFVGISVDEYGDIKDVKTLEKIIKKNIDKSIKNLPKLSDEEFQKGYEKVKQGIESESYIPRFMKEVGGSFGEKKQIFFSELRRLFNAMKEELQKRKSKQK